MGAIPTFSDLLRLSRRDVLCALYSLTLLLLMEKPVRGLVEFALDLGNKHASQILIIPLISAALIYRNRRNIFKNVRYSVLRGTLAMLLGLALFAAARTVGENLNESDQLALFISSLVVLWLGGFLFFYGPVTFKTALFPLLFLVFCIPIPSMFLDRIVAVLQRESTDMAFVLLKLTGVPIHREGVVLTLPDVVIEVAPQCSGIRSFISLFISSMLAGHLFLESLWRRSILLLATIPILIFKNALRIGALSWLAVYFDKGILASHLHQEGGIPFFAIGLLLIYPILVALVKWERNIIEGRRRIYESSPVGNADFGPA